MIDRLAKHDSMTGRAPKSRRKPPSIRLSAVHSRLLSMHNTSGRSVTRTDRRTHEPFY